VATFTGLSLAQAGAGYVIQASAPLAAPVMTNPVAVTPFSNIPQLVVTAQPSAAVGAGTSFGLTVTVEDAYGRVDPAFQGPITLGLAGGPAGGVLGGPITATAIQGVATFSGLWLNRAGPYTLSASADGTSSGLTSPLTVIPGSASQLVVTTGPPGVVPFGSSFPLVVTAEDAYGNTATTYNQVLTASLTGSVGPGFAGGGVVATAVDGVADFPDFLVGTPGVAYTIRVAAGAAGLSAVTTPFSVVKGSSTSSPIVAERVLIAGKGPRKHVIGFQLEFGAALDPSRAGDPANYAVTRTVRRGRRLVAQAVKVTPRYDPGSNAVTLLVSGQAAFPRGGRIFVKASPPSGITNTLGGSFGGDFAFIIKPGARVVHG
jgi:hypothetical protein